MVSPTVDAIAGFASGSCSIAAGQPFDTVKVRMQTQTPRLFRNTFHCFSDTIQVEGWRALCKGVWCDCGVGCLSALPDMHNAAGVT